MSRIYSLVLFLLVCSSVTGSALYIGVKELQLFRIMIALSLSMLVYIYVNQKLYLDKKLKFLLIFFCVDFMWEATISIFFTNIDLNNFLNQIVLLLFMLSLILLAGYNNMKFIKWIYLSSLMMFFVMLFISIWEIITKDHLAISNINEAELYMRFIPSTFFTNQNDFIATMTLIFLLVINIHNKFESKKLLEILMMICILTLSFITSSRVNILVLMVIIATYLLKPKEIIAFSTILLLGIVVVFTNINFLNDSLGINFDYLMSGVNMGKTEGESIDVRSQLFWASLHSIGYNHSLGYGINNSSIYFLSLHDSKLQGIINPHNYLLEILVNGGLFIFSLYCLMIVYIIIEAFKSRQYKIILTIFCYYIILISSSSSLFLWYHYVFFVTIVLLIKINRYNIDIMKTKM